MHALSQLSYGPDVRTAGPAERAHNVSYNIFYYLRAAWSRAVTELL